MWLIYSLVWRRVLIHVLEWSEPRVDAYIEELRDLMETSTVEVCVFDFFYDEPFAYLVRAFLDDGLRERIEKCSSEEAGPVWIWQRLVDAVTESRHAEELVQDDFDWTQARLRYQAERRRIEEWLTTLE